MLYPVKLKDAHIFLKYLNLLKKQDFEFKNELLEVFDDEGFKKMLEGNHIFDLMHLVRAAFPNEQSPFTVWYDLYVEIFEFLFKEDVFHKIETADEFEFYRDLILISNGLDFEKPNPNPEIQIVKDIWNKIQQAKGEIPSFEDKVSSVAIFYGGDIKELTLYQLDSFFVKAVKHSMWTAQLIGSMFSESKDMEKWFIEKETKKEEVTISKEEIEGASSGTLDDSSFILGNNKE